MTSGPETALVRQIRGALEKALPGVMTIKLAGGPYQMAGLPDLLVIHEGRLLGLEVKCPRAGESLEHAKGRLTPQQLKCLLEMKAAGAGGEVVASVEEAVTAATNYFKGDLT